MFHRRMDKKTLKGGESCSQVMGWRQQHMKAADAAGEDAQVSVCEPRKEKLIQKASRNLVCFTSQRHHLHS